MPCSRVSRGGKRCAACWQGSNRKRKCSCSAGASRCRCRSNPVDMTMPSGRACLEATAAGARKRISKNWDFDIVGRVGNLPKVGSEGADVMSAPFIVFHQFLACYNLIHAKQELSPSTQENR